jgi:hypothetical protein
MAMTMKRMLMIVAGVFIGLLAAGMWTTEVVAAITLPVVGWAVDLVGIPVIVALSAISVYLLYRGILAK